MHTPYYKIYRVIFSILFLILFNISYAPKSYGDINSPFIQITCASHLKYISIRTFHIWNTGFDGDTIKSNTPVKSIDESGIYELRKFTAQEYKCDLLETKIRIITNEFIEDLRGKCSEDAKFTVSSNNENIYSFFAYGRCKGISHQIDIHYYPYGVGGGKSSFDIRDCELTEAEYSDPKIQPQCKNISFPSESTDKPQK